MRYVGTLRTWNDDRGFGFIVPRGGGEEVFFHISASRLQDRPTQGLVVSYELGTDAKGRRRAERIRPADWQPAEAVRSVPLWIPIAVSVAGLACLLYLSIGRGLPTIAPLWFVTASFVTFWMYGLDKRQAGTQGWRASEKSLHMAALLGGWPGALAAQHIFRHKRRKATFMIVFWFTVVLNVVVLVMASTGLS